jgi:peptide chain release factor
VTAHVLQITSGTGPVEVRRFVALLAARLEALAQARGLVVTEVASRGGGDAPRSIALYVDGDAPSVLADEVGTHALVERSAARGRAGRKRWFAAVALHDHVAVPSMLRGADLPRADLVITACRAGGPGGQHVNKVSSAVRVEHVPTGLIVRCASDRSQHANLARALDRLAALVQGQAVAVAADAARARRLDHHRVERGRAIRTYTLGPDRALRVDGAA